MSKTFRLYDPDQQSLLPAGGGAIVRLGTVSSCTGLRPVGYSSCCKPAP